MCIRKYKMYKISLKYIDIVKLLFYYWNNYLFIYFVKMYVVGEMVNNIIACVLLSELE